MNFSLRTLAPLFFFLPEIFSPSYTYRHAGDFFAPGHPFFVVEVVSSRISCVVAGDALLFFFFNFSETFLPITQDTAFSFSSTLFPFLSRRTHALPLFAIARRLLSSFLGSPFLMEFSLLMRA